MNWRNLVRSVSLLVVALICSGNRSHFCAFHYFPKLCKEIQSWGEVSGEWGDRSSGEFILPSGPAVPGHKLLAVPLGMADLYSMWCVITELMRMWQNLDSVIHLLNLGFQKSPH